MPHGVPTDGKIQNGFLTMDFGVKKDGWCSDMTRTVCVGTPTQEMRLIYDTVLEAQLQGIAAVHAGVTGREVDGAARRVIEDAGYGDCFGHGFGHGLGLEIHEPPTASPGYDKPLPRGAVISAEPGIYLPGRFGVRIEDVVYITDGGCENITKTPKNLIII
jgi:Xaa-Pro aminopeptidase